MQMEGFFVNIRKQLRGAEMVVTGVDTNWSLRCPEDCREMQNCPLRRLCNRPGSLKFRLALVSLVVANPTDQPFSLPVEGWELVDGQGFAVGGAAVCERLLPVDHVQADLWSITPDTRIRTMLAFPLGNGVRELICSDGDTCVRFSVAPAQRRESLKGGKTLKLKKRGKIRITECWSQRDEEGRRQYVLIGRKK